MCATSDYQFMHDMVVSKCISTSDYLYVTLPRVTFELTTPITIVM
jgi:hypothetical protein